MEVVRLMDAFFHDQERYDVLEEIGQGTYSEVRKGFDRRTNTPVALKEMFLNEDRSLPLHVERELSVLKTVQSPFVLNLCGVFSKLCRAVADLHAHGFVHRDLAPANVLLADDGSIRLGDFGQSRRLQGRAGESAGDPPAQAPEQPQAWTPGVGTRWYRSPELLFGSRRYGQGVDAWSVGMIAAHAFAGRPLCDGASDIDQICKMHDRLGQLDTDNCPAASTWPDYGKLLFPATPAKGWDALLPRAEPGAAELCAGLLTYDPDTRWTVQDALGGSYFRGAMATQEEIAAYLDGLHLTR